MSNRGNEWKRKNRKRANELQLKYYYRDRDKILKKNKTKKVRKYKRDWHHKNKERRLKQLKQNNHNAQRSLNGRYSSLKQTARIQDLDFTIRKEQHKILLKQNCHYCNGPLAETGSGLDRIDNQKGYIISNVVPCCSNCNRIKCHLLTSDETLLIIKALKKFRKGKNTWPVI